MKIEESNYFKLLGGPCQYQIPLYQRKYKWQKNDCERLLSDIKNAGQVNSPSHFIGSIIIKKDDTTKVPGLDIYNVIDGQQRTTTICLLVLALFEYWEKNSIKITDQTIEAVLKGIKNNMLLNQTFNSTSLYSKLSLKNGENKNEYENLLRGVSGNGQITKNYQFFYDSLKSNSITIESALQGIGKLMLACVILDSNDNAQLLFEAVNDTGVDLTESDKIRNWLFMNLPVTIQDNLYRKYWEPIEDKIEKELNNFLRYYVELKLSKKTGNEYYKDFKQHFIISAGKKDGVENILKDIEKYFKFYCKYKNAKESSKNKIDIQLVKIRNTGKDESIPLILHILEKATTINEDDVLDMLRWVESFIVRRDILGRPTNSLGPAFFEMIKHCNSKQDLKNVSTLYPLDNQCQLIVKCLKNYIVGISIIYHKV